MITDNTIKLSPKSSVHLVRKLWHCGTGAIGIAIFQAGFFESQTLGQILVFVAIVAFFIEWLRLRFKVINKPFCQLAAPLMRDTEVHGPTGFAFYALGVGLALLIFDREVALLACSYLVFADPIASLIGVKYGKTKIWNGRSLEGTFAFFTIGIMINLYFYQQGMFLDIKNFVLFSIITSISAATAEVICHGKYLDDNLVIPLVGGTIITFSRLLF